LLAVLLPAHLACALATTLPDEPSDRRSRKRTAAVLLGKGPAKALIVALHLAAIAALGWVRGWQLWLLLPLTANLSQLLLWRSNPGSRGLTIQVGLAVLVTLTLVGGIAFNDLWSAV
jgi:1,4-dihydroxy-2-naphthoate octaprenyltransferase